jgi:ABC-type sugar transport system substrate-binding protein
LRKIVNFAIVIGLCAGLASCGQSKETGGADQARKETIALFTKNQTNPYFQTIRVAAQAAARMLNVEVVDYIPTKNDSISEQMSQIEDAITKRPDAVVFIPVDSKALLSKAKAVLRTIQSGLQASRRPSKNSPM